MNKWRDPTHQSAPAAVDSANDSQAPPDADPFEESELRLYVLGRVAGLLELRRARKDDCGRRQRTGHDGQRGVSRRTG
jgi:hypothetical protein